jgi:DNA topoisomerase-1
LKNLLIVESPAKSKTIEKYLGKDYKVLASYGHIRDLPSKDGSVDVENFDMHYKTSKDKERHIKAIVAEAKKSDQIYLATDLDREGEAISWHVLEEMRNRIKGFDIDKVKRIAFGEITKKALQAAVASPRDLDMSLVNAQQARRALDYLVGFNLSPVLWRKVKGGLSAGRVQSVALRLICEREQEIEDFNPEEYWSVEGDFKTPEGKNLKAKLTHLQGDKLEKFTLNNEKLAKDAVSALEGGDYTITDIVKKKTRRSPAAPFITSTLQMEASRKLGFGAKRTMMAAQRLYEQGLITYMRTDSVNLSSEALGAVRETITDMYGPEFVPKTPNVYKTKTQNAQEAHEAIRPTNMNTKPDKISVEDEDHRKLYKLVWQRTIASQMEKAILDQTALVIEDKNKNIFRATGSIVAFEGFMKVYLEGKDDEKEGDSDEGKLLPNVEKDDAMDLVKINPDQHFTEPPPRYSEATLVKNLEEKGIGRPSTYASIISTIQDRGYVRQDKKRFYPEDIGRIVSKFLVQHFNKYVDYNFTANMEETLDEVSRGEKEWKPMLKEFWAPFKSNIDDKMESVKKSDVTTEKTGEKCPTCTEGELLIRLGRYGRFKGCSRYPECKHIENLVGNTAEEKLAAEAAKEPPRDTGVCCPKCKENQIVEKKSRRGKVFFACSGYPKCQYAIWDEPQVNTECPGCKWPFIMKKETKRQGTIMKCPECEWQDPPKPEPKSKKKTDADAANDAIADATS